MGKTPATIRAALVLASILFALGLFAPSMTIVPHFGELTRAVKIFKPNFDRPQEVSIASGIVTLLRAGEYTVGTVILVFSVLFPLWKLGVLWGGVESVSRHTAASKELLFIEKLGKFSMLDVYVMALLVICIKGLPGGTEVKLNWGLISFCLSVVLTMKITQWIESAGDSRLKGE